MTKDHLVFPYLIIEKPKKLVEVHFNANTG